MPFIQIIMTSQPNMSSWSFEKFVTYRRFQATIINVSWRCFWLAFRILNLMTLLLSFAAIIRPQQIRYDYSWVNRNNSVERFFIMAYALFMNHSSVIYLAKWQIQQCFSQSYATYPTVIDHLYPLEEIMCYRHNVSTWWILELYRIFNIKSVLFIDFFLFDFYLWSPSCKVYK